MSRKVYRPVELPADDGVDVGDVVWLRLGVAHKYERFFVDVGAGLGVVGRLPGIALINTAALVPELRPKWPRGYPVGVAHLARKAPGEQHRDSNGWQPWILGILGEAI